MCDGGGGGATTTRNDKKHAFSALFVQSDISVCNILPKLVNCYISNNNSCSYIEFPVIHGNS